MSRPPKIRRLVLSNVLSWPSLCLDAHPGLNVVVGPSDSGKTNVYRALRAIVENAPPAKLLSIGKTFGSASIEFDDGAEVHLGKGVGKSAANEYGTEVGGVSQCYKQVGSECPPPVAAVLRLGPVSLSGIETDVHFSAQRGPAFGVDAKPGDLAKIIGAVSGLDVVYVALAEAERSRKAAQTEDTAANADFEKKRAAYKARESAFSFEQAKVYRDRVREIINATADADARAADLRRIEAGIRAVSSSIASAAREVEIREKAHARIEAVAGKLVESRERVGVLRGIAEELDEVAESIKSESISESLAVANLARDERVVHELVKVECPLCGRKGKP